MTVQALNIHVSPSTQKLKADTDVRTILKPKKARRPPPGAAARRRRQSETHVPAMLKADKQVNVTSNRLDYDGVAEATYSGSALLWQEKSRIEGETIVMNDRTGNLTARGKVRTTMIFEDEDPKTKVRTLTETRANADMLVYDDAKRLATYTATGTTPATLKNAQGDMSGKRIDLFLKEGGSELERAEADGNVAVKLETLYATAKHLVYTAATEHVRADGRSGHLGHEGQARLVQGDARQHGHLRTGDRQYPCRRHDGNRHRNQAAAGVPRRAPSLNGHAADPGPDEVLRRAYGGPRRQPRDRLG